MTEYMPHVSPILLGPCLSIYPRPLCVLKINLVSRQPHPIYVLTIGLTTRPKHHSLCRYYKLNHDTTAALCICSSFKNEVTRLPLRNDNRFNHETITYALCDENRLNNQTTTSVVCNDNSFNQETITHALCDENIDYYMALFISHPLSALGHDISPIADRLKG